MTLPKGRSQHVVIYIELLCSASQGCAHIYETAMLEKWICLFCFVTHQFSLFTIK